MIFRNILQLTAVAAAYLALFSLGPFWLRGYKLSDSGALEKLIASFLIGHVAIILTVLSLSFVGIYSRPALIAALAALAAGYLALFRRTETLSGIRALRRTLSLFLDGYYHPRLILRTGLASISRYFSVMLRKIDRPATLACSALIFGYGAYIRCYHAATNLFYGSSDMYLHTEWTKMLMQNQPYAGGVYPFGFHAVMAAVADVFGFNIVTVMRMMGPIAGMLCVFSLYYLMRKTMRSAFAALAALAVYVVADLMPYWAMERQILALPQEFGSMFLYLATYYLYKYLTQKQSRDLFVFSAAVSLTLLTHFYVTLFTGLLCVAIFVFHITRVNWKTFLKLVAGVLAALMLAVATLGAGLLMGIPFNGSVDWALSFFMEEAPPPAPEGQEEPPEESVSPIRIFRTLRDEGYFMPGYKESPLNLVWFIPLMASALLALCAPFLKVKNRERLFMYPAYAAYALMLMVFYILASLEIFSLTEDSRLYAFFTYSVPLVLAVPLEIMHALLYESGVWGKKRYAALTCALGVAAAGWLAGNKRFMPLGRVLQLQHNGAVQAYYNIAHEFPRNSWTIVSSMTEYAQCLFEGYHYEMADYVRIIDTGEDDIELPTRNVFFFVVKRPNVYVDSALQRLGAFETLPKFDPEDARRDLTDAYKIGPMFTYQDYPSNRALQAKAAAWAEEYRKYYPDEMTVYYEDDAVVVYHIEQNVYALNRFVIPYTGGAEKAAVAAK